MVGFQVFYDFARGSGGNVGDAIGVFFQLSLGGIGVGLLAGIITYYMSSTFHDPGIYINIFL